MKKLLNDPDRAVHEFLSGFAQAHSDLVQVHFDPTYVVRTGGATTGKVGIVSGGGSGHEPLHCGFVGDGMLDAAVPGAIFTSPVPEQLVPAMQAADGGAGVLAIVKNYTGDVLNFEIAVELAGDEGLDVSTVLVNDDVAVEDSTHTAGRRGVAGTLLVEKMAGAAAVRGADLKGVTQLAQRVTRNVRSMGVAVTACTVPHVGSPSFNLPDDQLEIGIGIHGEPGRRRVEAGPVDEVAPLLLDPIADDLGLSSGERVLLFVNGMGGTPESELYVLYARARHLLEVRGATVVKSLVGSYVTSLEMQGASITVLRLDAELEALWDAPVQTAALRW